MNLTAEKRYNSLISFSIENIIITIMLLFLYDYHKCITYVSKCVSF